MSEIKKWYNFNSIYIIIVIFLMFSISINTSIVFAETTEFNLTYDGNGNLIQGFGRHYEYDDFNQLKRIRENVSTGDIIEEYTYDHEGNRIKKFVIDNTNGNNTIYYVNENFVRIVNDSGTFDEIYYYHNDILVGKNGTNDLKTYYHPDHLGGTNIVTNETGNKVEETTYLPFGEVFEGGESRFTFTGKEKDSGGKLFYYGARYYDPYLRHFVQPDSIIPDIYNPQDLNRYSYVRNNPYKYVDPSGNSLLAALGVYYIIRFPAAVLDLTVVGAYTYLIGINKDPNLDPKLEEGMEEAIAAATSGFAQPNSFIPFVDTLSVLSDYYPLRNEVINQRELFNCLGCSSSISLITTNNEEGYLVDESNTIITYRLPIDAFFEFFNDPMEKSLVEDQKIGNINFKEEEK